MTVLSETQKTTLLVAYSFLGLYYVVCLYAAWLRPSLQRFWLLRPRWRGGVAASRFGLTTQAIFVFSLGAFGTSKIYSHPWTEAFGGICLIAAMLAVVGWGTDYGNHADRSR